jgi:peptidoglycan/LPS O-acetylase OafA/YrhL
MTKEYRKEIDGLRGIAVIAIIFYHSQITVQGYHLFRGGFIGVDIFFVISGYLITSIIFKNLVVGTFSFRRFCEKRIRRILPLLIFVILITFPFAWLYLYPGDFISYSKSSITSLSFSSNLFYHYSENVFGSIESLYKPLFHTWSLSILVQFYILFTIIFFLIFRFFKKFVIFFLILGFIISLGLAHSLSNYAPNFNFFSLPTRVWELLAGSIIAYFEIKYGRSKQKNLNLILPGVGLFLIAYSIFFFNDKLNVNIFHPSFKTLLPIIGVCLIIWFSSKNDLITKTLSSKLLVNIGLISYSLYLWHYPIFAFNKISNFATDNIFKELLLGIILVIVSIISYYLIERPFKNKKIQFKKFFIFINFFILTIFILNQLVVSKNGFKERYSKIYIKNKIDNKELENDAWEYIKNFTDQKFANNQKFQSKDKIKVLIIGDSHSLDLFNVFFLNKNLFKKYEFLRYGYNFFWHNNLSVNLNNKNISDFQNSEIFLQSDVILISNNFSDNETIDDKAFKKLEDFIYLFKKNKKIILTSNANIYKSNKKFNNLYSLTLFDYFLLNNADELKFIDKDLSSDDMYQINHYYFNNRKIDLTKIINDKLKLISKKNNITILNKQDFQCIIEKQICFGVTSEGFKTNYDPSHFTLEGAKFFGKRISKLNWLKLN